MTPVLIVTYYFPPSGGPGVQRTLKFVRYLREFGFEPAVLTVQAGAYPSHDEGLWADVPGGVEVVRTAAPDPFALYGRLTGRSRAEAVTVGDVGRPAGRAQRLATWARANVFLPDARVGWVPFARRAARRLIRTRGIGHVVTSGPPHSAHLIGLGVQRAGGRRVRWLADFRDPWTGINFYDDLPMSALARALDRRLERRVLRRADAVVTVSPTWAETLRARGDLPAGRVAVVHNGFDEADFAAVRAAPSADVFEIAHVGSLYGTRNPEALWAALGRLRREGRTPALRVRLVGRVDARAEASVDTHGLRDVVLVEPYVPHAEAVRRMASAALLLLSIEPFRNEAGMITGKLYEYLASGRPVLALGAPEGDAAGLLRETRGGALFARDDIDGMATYIAAHYDAWASGHPCAGARPEAIAPYSRRVQTSRLAEVLRRL